MKRVQAIKALRLNYRWRGVWIWLRASHRLQSITGHWYARTNSTGWYRVPGWRLVWSYPEAVTAEQTAIADGVIL